MDDLDKAVNEVKVDHGKKVFSTKERKPEAKEIKVSSTNPDSRFTYRAQKPREFFYLDHRKVTSLLTFKNGMFMHVQMIAF